ncbi:MAG: alpha/beta fold hydrolase [Pseudomonadota bacterium]
MTARLLQLLLLLQALAVGMLAFAALRYFGVQSVWLALLLALAALLLVRLLITANNFVLSWRFASATPPQFRLGLAARLRLFGEEFMATLLHSSWFMAKARPTSHIYPGSEVAPVLLLHGYGCNSGYWAHLLPLLRAARISHATLDLEPTLADIDDYVPAVARGVEALRQASGATEVTLVAHSMGGLVARAYLRDHGIGQIARVITLGTPHHGTSLANFGIGRNAIQMRRSLDAVEAPESAWLHALAATENAALRARITSIYTHHDNIIAPQTSSLLPDAHNIAFGGIGHVAMGRNPRILACVMAELGRAH